MSDDELMTKLEHAAGAVLRSERPAILHNRQKLASITIELTLANSGAVVDADVYTHRRGTLDRLVSGPMVPVGRAGD